MVIRKQCCGALARAALLGTALAGGAQAADRSHTVSDKLLLTGGVTQVEGAAGGGLTPWAVIGGYGTGDQIGGNAFYTRVTTSDYNLETYGALIGIFDRVELSFAKQKFDTGAPGVIVRSVLGAPTDGSFFLRQDIYGLKVRLLGEAVLDQDRWLPQVSIGLQHKINSDTTGAVAKAVGATDDEDTDIYLSATKLLLAQSLLLNGTVRATRANQFGLLGFGGDKNDSHEAQFEASFAYLLSPKWAVGGEFRTKPDNLGLRLGGARVLEEDSAWDVFVAYAPAKNMSLTLAYVDLGRIVSLASTLAGGEEKQRGSYVSFQVGY